WGFALAFVLSAAAVSRDIGSYLLELPFATFVQTTNLATIVLMVMSLPPDLVGSVRAKLGHMTSGLPTSGGTEIGRVDRFAVVAAAWVLLLSALLAVLAYEQQPHISDEVAYLYHA